MTKPQTGRINARLPPELARKVSYLQSRTNKSATEVLHDSIEKLYAAMHAEESPAALLGRSGFIGCADGDADLSSTYKAVLTTSLNRKTGAGKKK